MVQKRNILNGYIVASFHVVIGRRDCEKHVEKKISEKPKIDSAELNLPIKVIVI